MKEKDYKNYTDIIGKTVKVKIDRPLGSVHPNHSDIVYQVNYGYIEGIIAPDGEEQDAYILGINYPLIEFVGKVVAVIKRLNDVEDKWVVCPENMVFSKKEIEETTHFQEKYFLTEIIL